MSGSSSGAGWSVGVDVAVVEPESSVTGSPSADVAGTVEGEEPLSPADGESDQVVDTVVVVDVVVVVVVGSGGGAVVEDGLEVVDEPTVVEVDDEDDGPLPSSARAGTGNVVRTRARTTAIIVIGTRRRDRIASRRPSLYSPAERSVVRPARLGGVRSIR